MLRTLTGSLITTDVQSRPGQPCSLGGKKKDILSENLNKFKIEKWSSGYFPGV
jgi:hypothetical protein